MTEKNYNPEQKNAKAMKQQAKAVGATKGSKKVAQKVKLVASTKTPLKEKVKSKEEDKGRDKKVNDNKKELSFEKKAVEKKGGGSSQKKKTIKGTEKPKEKKSEAKVNSKSVPISTKYAVAICKFLKGKKVDRAIEDLRQVQKLKKAIPMKGEIPHRKGKIMSGRFPVRASESFITILKSLKGNALVNEIEEPVIIKAIANQAQRPFGRFGRVRRKRTHITLIAKSLIVEKRGSQKPKEKNLKEKRVKK